MALTASVGALAGLVGLAGLGALGLGIAAVGRRLGRGRRGRRGRGRPFRGRREIQQEEAQDINQLGTMLLKEDQPYLCGAKLVCELSRLEDDPNMPHVGRAILDMVEDFKIVAGEGVLPTTNTNNIDTYVAASNLGTTNNNCTQLFPNCPLGFQQLCDLVLYQ